MYNCHHNKVIKLLAIVSIFFAVEMSRAVWFDLGEKISSKFQSFYNGGMTDEYISSIYSPNFSKDPFGDAMSTVESKSMQLKIAWAQYIEDLLKTKWCASFSKKKIWWILYYFVPEFRAELASSLKQDLGDYDSQKYVFDKDKIMDYCREYFLCDRSEWNTSRTVDGEGVVIGKDLKWISSATPRDIETNCKEFFQRNYEEWQNNEKNMQSIQTAQLGADKYWNATTDDSPYDIMVDIGILARLLYKEAEEPITPVFYNLPVFSNSKNSLNQNKLSDSLTEGENWWWDSGGNWWDSWWNWWWSSGGDEWWTSGRDWWYTRAEPSTWGIILSWNDNWIVPLSEELVDDLLDWLNTLKFRDDWSEIYYNLCEAEDNELESETFTWVEGINIRGVESPDDSTFSDMTDQEYQELVDYMLSAVDRYTSHDLDEENIAIATGYALADSTDIEKVANKIKNCWSSCESKGLRIDLKASCMLKCACWEIKSPVFNSDIIPWLWPVFVIRFCTVPGVNHTFSVGWKRIHSIEDWSNEIYGAVDKLSREWRLWKWNQQYEFLDTSTKQMNVADSFAFTINVEFVDVFERRTTSSDQYKDRKNKSDNEKWKWNYHITNSLDNPVTKNYYRVLMNEWDIVQDFSSVATLNANRKSLSDVNETSESVVDWVKNANVDRYGIFAGGLGDWMDQQWTLWALIGDYAVDLDAYSKELYQKRCK